MRKLVKQTKTIFNPVRYSTILSGFALLILSLSALVVSPPAASAFDQFTPTDSVTTYCLSLGLNSNAEQGCNASNTDHARNKATYHCDSHASSDQKVKCVESKAKSYFKSAAESSPKPKTEAAFTNALNTVLSKVRGSVNVKDSGFGALAPTTSGDCSQGTCDGVNSDPEAACSYDNHCDLIKKYINPTINLLTMVFGLIATGSLIFAGIQYSASEGDPTKAGQAKNRIANTIFAIIAYLFLYGFLQFLIPGGRFK